MSWKREGRREKISGLQIYNGLSLDATWIPINLMKNERREMS
jgi:hypothetical protein